MDALRYPVVLAGVVSAVLVSCPATAASGPPAAQARQPVLRAGAARIDITPAVPLALEGYQDPENRISESVHDRLFARAVALSAGTRRLVVISCDIGSMMFGPYFLRLIQERWGLQPGEVLLCATHTHSGPQISLNADYPHPNNLVYTKELERQLVEVTGRALAAMTPARMAIGRGQSRVGVSRRTIVSAGRVEMRPNPEGAADPEVLVLALSRPGRAPLALLFDYASHSRSLRGTNRLVSGDIFGIAEQVVEQRARQPLVGAAFAGASGDVDPASVVDGFEAPPGEEPPTVRMGRLLGEEVLRAADAAVALRREAAIRTASARVAVPPKTAGPQKTVNVVVAAVGDVALVGLDAETSVEIGLAIKKASPFAATFVITNCNGWAGYLPTARQHEEGGYEVARSGFAPGAADVVIAKTVALLSSLR